MPHRASFIITILLIGLLAARVTSAATSNESVTITPAITTQPAQAGNDCAAFPNRVWAQTVFEAAPDDHAGLDPDQDGLACEELPMGIAPALWTDDVPEVAIPVDLASVTDGDTIEVVVDGRREPVRFVGIDAQEAGGPYRNEECFGQEASAFLRRVLEQEGQLFLEKDHEDRDRYGRLLRWVWLEVPGETYLLNEALVRAGYAERYRNTPNRRYVNEVIAAEDFARHNAFGLWAACEPQ